MLFRSYKSMNTANLHINSGSHYGQRLHTNAPVKARIAEWVVQNILLLERFDPRNPVFISDGSSASFVFWHFMQAYLAKPQNLSLNIFTNNLDVPMQVQCEPRAVDLVSVEFAPGVFRSEYCGVFGPATDEWIENKCVGSTCVLAVTGQIGRAHV